MITVAELLENGEYSCTMAGELEPECDFDWDSETMSLTESGYDYFRDVMEAPAYLLENGNISVDTSSDPTGRLDEEVCEFVNSVAGYCDADLFDAWFDFR